MTPNADQISPAGKAPAMNEINQRFVDHFAQLVTERVELLAEGPDRQRIVALAKRALREARATLSEERQVVLDQLPVSRLKASDVIEQGWVNLSQASLYRAAESGRFYCTTPKGRSIGKEFPLWQFVEPVPEMIAPVLSQLADQPSSEIHAFWVCAADELNDLSPAEVMAGKPFETRGTLHASQQALLDLPAATRVRRVQVVASHHNKGMTDIVG
ncbi:hypothetical protein [Rugamonas apoptosis]|uniref:Uncharacterized protein n=1 Tax=Rugamonas apoptosis TaxID=2758570 RepID=A0A7W2FFD1_9BURK|nr:hypothetical protein [Rugamonas apoptosis]MBA5690666.1 hypothetical protein [Rugamonas apoptosis]